MSDNNYQSPIEHIILEEFERQKALKRLYEEKINELPKGNLSFQKRNESTYIYLKFREGQKIVNKYLGAPDSEAVVKMKVSIEKRNELEEKLSKTIYNIKRMEKVYRARN